MSTSRFAMPSYSGMLGGPNLQNQLTSAVSQANTANQRRAEQAGAIYDEIINRYQPGGSFGKAALGQLETQKKKDVGKQTQGLISSGLYGTTTATGLGKQWESDVGQPSRLRLEDLMMERLSQAQLGKASFLERQEDVGPDLGQIGNLMSQTGGGGVVSGGGPVGGPSYMKMYGGGGAGGGTAGGGASGGSSFTSGGTSPGAGVASATVGFGPEGGQGTTNIMGEKYFTEDVKKQSESFQKQQTAQGTKDWTDEEKARGYKMTQKTVPGHDKPQWVKVFPDGSWGI